LVGEVSTQYHKNYYQKVQDYIATNHMGDLVDCHINCPPDKMSAFYRSADLFVLPSTGEFASISQLEAMSYSLPIIVSDTNGTACYIEDGKNGYLFKDKDAEDLKEKIIKIISDRENIRHMGAFSYLLVNEKYSFANYQAEIEKLIEK
ncbi:MAG: glycosyltransferase family 4 protein, partial [Butyrivibrio sp.]|nr:glycosyltransferase family 4 protein [Butyrivibrio sp.]